ncbi:CDGP domain-containing protein [Mycobacterium sp.]|uniref:CDGP domain-containing protein n=1 Tax=Mycobacterium sp. TaxID=1785 RepID=UPI003C7617A2
MAFGLIGSAPPASAGRQYGEISVSKRDGPSPADRTWQRCVVWNSSNNDSYSRTDRRCDVMGPDPHPWGLAVKDPPTHIDD